MNFMKAGNDLRTLSLIREKRKLAMEEGTRTEIVHTSPPTGAEKRIALTSFSDSIDHKWGSIVMGSIGIMVIVFAYLAYRFLRTINQRLHSLEEILAKVIEKNNHLQHMIQASATTRFGYPPQVEIPHVQSSTTTTTTNGACPMRQPAAPCVSISLDREILEELKELESPPILPPPTAPSTPPTAPPTAPSTPSTPPPTELKEGRIDDTTTEEK
jgi:hypothetical protein